MEHSENDTNREESRDDEDDGKKHILTTSSERRLSHSFYWDSVSSGRVNQIHLGLKVIPAGLPSLATKNTHPHPKEIRIKAATQPNNKKVPAICGLAVPSEGMLQYRSGNSISQGSACVLAIGLDCHWSG